MEAKLLTNMRVWYSFTLVRAVVSGEASTDIESRGVIWTVEAFRALYGICVSSWAVVTRFADSAVFVGDGVWTLRLCTAFANITFITD